MHIGNVSVCSMCSFIPFHFLYVFILIQHGVPAFTVPQPQEAMSALEYRASQLGVSWMSTRTYGLVHLTIGEFVYVNTWS